MKQISDTKKLTAAFLTLLFFSGFTSLVYEVIWTRQLLSTFGATVYASGTVLTSFMAGLALGSYLASRLVDRSLMHPLRIYAWLELGIGIYATIFPYLLQGITSLHVGIYRSFGGSFYALSLLRFSLAFLILLLPAVFMGATLPVVTRHGVSFIGDLGRKLGGIYAINTSGAAVGTFLSGHVFIEQMGIRKTSGGAVGLNLLLFAGAMLLARSTAQGDGGESPAGDEDRKTKAGKREKAKKVPYVSQHSDVERWLLLLVIGVSGACALAYEVFWSRILVYVLGNFVHSFSLMLAALLSGIALGSYALGRVADRMKRPATALALFQVIIGLAAIILLPVFASLVDIKDEFLASLSFAGSLEEYRDPWWTFVFWKLGLTFLVMLVPALMMGASFPMANRLYVRRREELGRGVGAIYAANTLGAILGSFAASFVLIPWLGLRDACLAAAALNLLAGGLLVARSEGRWRAGKLGLAVGGVAAVIFIAALVLPRSIFHPVFASAEKGARLVYVDETVSGTITIHETPSGLRVIDINGLNVAGTKFGFHCTQKLQAHFPMLMHPEPKRVMQIGFGTGGTCFSVSLHSSVERIDCVEINPGVIKAAPFFFENNHGVLDDPRVTVTIEDARNYVLTTPNRYDVILSDSIHPRFTGNGLLYTRDYFELCAEILKDGGIFSTWLPTAFLGDEEFRMIVRSMQAVFPHVLIWYMNNTVEGYTITMASRAPFRIDWDDLDARIAEPALAEDLAAVHVQSVCDLLDFIIVADNELGPYLGEGPFNTEDRPLIEFRAPRNMNRRITEYRNLERLMAYRSFPKGVIANWGADEEQAAARRKELAQFYEGTQHVLNAHQFHLWGQSPRELAALRKATEVNPDDRDAPYLLERLQEMMQGHKMDW